MANAKREEFKTGRKQHKGPNRVATLMVALVAIAIIGTFFANSKSVPSTVKRWEGGNYNIGETRDYEGQIINMTTIANQVEGGKIYLPLQEVINNNLVYSNYEAGDGNDRSLMAYISPSGRLVAAFAVCEPCRSLSFHIDGNILVCDTCGSRWKLEGLAGISGGCPQYPPEELPYEIKDGQIILDENIVKSWTPRV